jgi:hypothetical protein
MIGCKTRGFGGNTCVEIVVSHGVTGPELYQASRLGGCSHYVDSSSTEMRKWVNECDKICSK